MEKRKNKRMKVKLQLKISSLFKQDNVKVEQMDAPIEVTDISRSGIGFQSQCNFPVGFYFNACIQLEAEEANLYCVVKILWQEKIDAEFYSYGCEFVGLAPVLACIIEEYEQSLTTQIATKESQEQQ